MKGEIAFLQHKWTKGCKTNLALIASKKAGGLCLGSQYRGGLIPSVNPTEDGSMVLPSLSKIDHQKAQGGSRYIYTCKSFKGDPIDVIFVKIPHHQVLFNPGQTNNTQQHKYWEVLMILSWWRQIPGHQKCETKN